MNQHYLFENGSIAGISNDPQMIEEWKTAFGEFSVLSCDVFEEIGND